MALFQRNERDGETVSVTVDGNSVRLPAGSSAAAAVLLADTQATRRSAIDGSPRGPYCLMGVCFECLMTVDGQAEVQACMVPACEGMVIATCGDRGAGA